MADQEDPPTERTRAIRESIAVHSVQARRWGVALKVVIVLTVLCAVGFLVLLVLRIVGPQALPG